MCGKWSSLKAKLPKFKLEPTFAAKVNEARGAYVALGPAELARELVLQQNAKESFEDEISKKNIEIEAISQCFVELMEGAATQKITLDSGTSCSVEDMPYITVADTPAARAAYQRWLARPEIRKLLTLNAKTREGFVKEELMKNFAAGKPIAKPIAAWVKVFIKSRAKLNGQNKENSNTEGE